MFEDVRSWQHVLWPQDVSDDAFRHLLCLHVFLLLVSFPVAARNVKVGAGRTTDPGHQMLLAAVLLPSSSLQLDHAKVKQNVD